MYDPYHIYWDAKNDELKRTARFHYEVDTRTMQFPYKNKTDEGWEYAVLDSTIDIVYRVTHGSYSPYADSPDDYYDTYTVVAWNVTKVTDDYGDEIDPEKVLTEDELQEYNSYIEEFVEGF